MTEYLGLHNLCLSRLFSSQPILGGAIHKNCLNCEHVLFVYILKQKQNKVHGFDNSVGSRERTIVPQERRPALTIAVNVNKSSHIRFPICIVLIQLQWAVVLCTELICKLILLFIRSKDTKIVINIVPSALLIKKIKFKKNKKLKDLDLRFIQGVL